MDRKKLITAAALLVGALVIVIAVMSDDQGLTGVSGTMATPDTVTGVQPATRYRAPQIARNDLQLDDPTFVQLMQNEAFREIVQSGDMALIAAIEQLSRTADLDAVADLARTDALDEVPDVLGADEFGQVSELAAEIPLEEVADAAEDGTLSALAEIVRDQFGFDPIEAMLTEDELIRIVNMAQEKPIDEEFSTLDVIEEVYEKDFADEFKEALEAIPAGEEGSSYDRRNDKWIQDHLVNGAFARTDLATRIEGLYRAGYLGAVRDLFRTGFAARTEALFRAGYLDNVAKMARTEGSLESVASMFRTEGSLEAFARVARTDGFERTVAFMASEPFQLTAKLNRVEAIEGVGALARAGYLDQVDLFARTEGINLMGRLAESGRLWRVAEMAESGELARTIGEF